MDNPIELEGNIVRKIFVPDVLTDYNILWGENEEWERRIQAADEALSAPLNNLAVNWKCAWNNARSPFLTMRLVSATVGEGFSIDALWKKLVKESEYHWVLLGSQSLAYTAFYFAYECFLTECCAIKLIKKPSDFIGYGKISKAIEQSFSKKIEQEVWSHPDIEIARLARNALVHEGGVPGERLESLKTDLIFEGSVSIHPSDNAQLFQLLKRKVDKILNEWT